jgi:tetratricopeptide (TPR) repeat protein
MASTAENIIGYLFETPLPNNVSAEQLKQMTEEHPYFGAAHFLFAKRLFLSKQADYHQALQKAAIHFPNELWLHYNLNEDGENIADNKAVEAGEVTTIEAGNNNEAENVIASGPDEILIDEEESQVEDYIEDAALNAKLSSILQEQAAEFEKPVESSTEIPVETIPYHRVDYFDSQGIKLEEVNNDKLGTQLKRFTDWLKQMKRINPNPASLGNDEAGEDQVQGIAAHSNEAEEIVTEAMAEVLLKQGKPEQAIHIYEKLSFNNPSKSAYFAAKIEELKG